MMRKQKIPSANTWWWGRSTSVDLHECKADFLSNPAELRRFVRELTTILEMKRVGPTKIKRFGHGKLRGYSLMQFIETSTIVAHCDEFGRRMFIDIFSCRKYNSQAVAAFCKKFFNAKKTVTYIEERK